MGALAIGQSVSFTTGSGWDHSGHVGQVIALGPRVVTIEANDRHYTKDVRAVYPGRLEYARTIDGKFLRESALEYASRIDEAIRTQGG